MKNLIILAAIFVTTFANASIMPHQSEILLPVMIKSVSASGDLMPVIGPYERTITTEIEVEVELCRSVDSENLGIKFERLNDSSLFAVTIGDSKMYDCKGLPRRQTVRFETEKLPAHANIVVKNPLLVNKNFTY
jgi:hypothetical protein